MEHYFRETHHEIMLSTASTQPFPPHFHDEIEILFTLEGKTTACCNGIRYQLRSGSIFLVSPNMIHAYEAQSEQYQCILLIVDSKLLSGPAAGLDQLIPDIPVWEDPTMQSSIWPLIRLACTTQNSISQESLILLLSTVISLILENMELKKAVASKQSIRLLLDYCRTHFREPISLHSLSKELHFSESYISHSFSNILKISLPDYINGLRLNEAVRLLKNTKLTITEAALQAGFPTSRTFNRVFWKQFGITPSEFKKSKF